MLDGVPTIVVSVVLTLLGREFFVSRAEKRRKEEEHYREFYGPLNIYLIIIDATQKHKNEIIESMSKRIRENGEPEISKEISDAGARLQRPLLDKIWQYVNRINHLIEMHPDKIKPEHSSLFREFIYTYITRQTIGNDRPSNLEAVQRVFSLEDVEVAENEVITVLERLKKEFMINP